MQVISISNNSSSSVKTYRCWIRVMSNYVAGYWFIKKGQDGKPVGQTANTISFPIIVTFSS